MTMHNKTSRFDIQFLADIFADFYEVMAAFTALTRLRFVVVVDARQGIRKAMSSGRFFALYLNDEFFLRDRFRFNGGHIFIKRFIK